MDGVNPSGSGWLAPANGMDGVNPPGSGWLAPANGMDGVNPPGSGWLAPANGLTHCFYTLLTQPGPFKLRFQNRKVTGRYSGVCAF